ncbi:MAG TPA: hypothetical protein VKG22_04655 [Stellaceae bacterium]|nr:hypothetical protein [Stellaceae bacterium]
MPRSSAIRITFFPPFRGEMDRLFDGFGSGFGFPSLRRMFDLEPAWRSSFSFSDFA